MNIEFTSAHMQTLCELKELAEKHGCLITFGVDQGSDFDSYEHFIGYTEEVIKELEDRGFFHTDEAKSEYSNFWFQLYDPNNTARKHHILQYNTGRQIIEYEFNWEPDDDDPISEEAANFLRDNIADWCNYDDEKKLLYTSYANTEVIGFDGQPRPNVYREGMALKFFGDLVCDYLGEERIQRVY